MRHHGVADALAKLAGDLHLEQDGPHVAFVLTVNGVDMPQLWVACDDGLPRLWESHSTGGTKNTKPSSWSWPDVEDADTTWRQLVMWTRIRMRSSDEPFKAAVEQAVEARERSQTRQMTRALEAAAHDAAHPWVCTCKQRFATERGLNMHRSRSRRHSGEANPLLTDTGSEQ